MDSIASGRTPGENVLLPYPFVWVAPDLCVCIYRYIGLSICFTTSRYLQILLC